MGLRSNLSMQLHGLKHISRNVDVIKDGQSTNYAILQTAHRLEKGLCIRNPRAGWGFDKANRLVRLVVKEGKQESPDTVAMQIGTGVLAAYVEAKRASEAQEDVEGLKKLLSLIDEVGLQISRSDDGGAILLKKEDVIQDAAVERLFLTRHSVRDFADTPVEKEKLERAVTLALRAPSACNRQATQVYVLSGEERIRAGAKNEYHADRYLIITGNMKAFNLKELNDWIVSSSVFCGYLSLALHAEGIGSCVFRKEIIRNSSYNDQVRAICHIPDDEQIILEMAIGNYKDEFKVPMSRRRDAKDVLHFHD